MTAVTTSTSTRATSLAVLAAILIIIVMLVTEPIAQDPGYHAFADGRRLFGVPNFLNVISNLPLLLAGAWGLLMVVRRSTRACAPMLQSAYLAFFAGVLLASFGSAYYHLAPTNDSLVWDRLPMSIAFAAFFAIVVGEYVSLSAARRLLLPLLIVGVASVAYWAVSETSGAGDLRPYAVVQFLPMLIIPGILLACKSEFGSTRPFWLMIACYLLAKIVEHYDSAIYATGAGVSGHTLKHIIAALAPLVLLYALRSRNIQPQR